MAETEVAFNPADQATIAMPNGVTLTGVGGDVEALTEVADERHEARTGKEVERVEVEAQPRQKRGQKRFDELTFKAEEAIRRADAAEAKARDLESKIATPATAVVEQPKTAAQEFTRPKPQEAEIGTKYQSLSDYIEDLTDWKAEQRDVKLKTELDARLAKSIEDDRASRTRASYVDQVFTAGRTAHADFDATLASADKFIWAPWQQEAILSMPNPHELMYGLAKDHTKLQAILAIKNPVTLGMELGALITRTEAVASPASTPVAVRTTNAPAPPQPVGAGSRTVKPTLQELAEKGDTDGYKSARAAGQTV